MENPFASARPVSSTPLTEHDGAIAAVQGWLRKGDKSVFRLFGPAGSGKTTLARHLAALVPGTTVFGTFSGKAASVLRQKGCGDAMTLHKLIYTPQDDGKGGVTFVRNPRSPLSSASLLIVDEGSNVDARLTKDILSFNRPIIVLGDPYQLPPINGEGPLTQGTPDYVLTEIHRQADHDPIVELATLVRNGKALRKGQFGNSRVITARDLKSDWVAHADQVLVGTNERRRQINRRIRELRGFNGSLPVIGDKLLCTMNNIKKNLFNGETWIVQRVMKTDELNVWLEIVPDHNSNRIVQIVVRREFFLDQEDALTAEDRRASDHFTYGYALTVHKSQGSQWGNVVLFDDSQAFRQHPKQWLYTGITRASRSITVVQ